MTQDWLLVETLGDQPVVVAQGRTMKNFVPLAVFLRRNPSLAAIQTAITETVTTGNALASITPKNKRVIRTEPVQMSDGRLHAVHVWCGPKDQEPPERPVPGPLVWDFTTGEANGTVEYLVNAGMDPSAEAITGRAFVEDIPSRSLNPDEAKVLALAIDAAPDRTYCSSWEFTDKQGNFRRVGFNARTAMETMQDGSQHLIARAMNLVEEVQESARPPEQLAHRIIEGLAQPGVYRLMVDLNTWTLLKWIDDPCPYFNWRSRAGIHPDDREHFSERMAAELETGSTRGVLRVPANDGGWVPLHVTVSKVELDDGVYGGLVTLRQPTEVELVDAGLDQPGP
ncbi:MAG: hypothetical protein FGM52_04155 [Mycobacterium sp.]|nr:hypothetical protein [Mycobacterium sp.]